jgi:hypothetical protein
MALQSPEAARLRWFMLPSEAVAVLKGRPAPARECAVVDGLLVPCVPAGGAQGLSAGADTPPFLSFFFQLCYFS